jgi:hypothetical protein
MSRIKKSFVELCVQGKASPDEIDDFVEQWHSHPEGSLHDFLGMKKSEYALWVKDPDALAGIIKARREALHVKS